MDSRSISGRSWGIRNGGAEIHLEKLPVSAKVARSAKQHGLNVPELAYLGGEDFELLVVEKGNHQASGVIDLGGVPLTRIGIVTAAETEVPNLSGGRGNRGGRKSLPPFWLKRLTDSSPFLGVKERLEEDTMRRSTILLGVLAAFALVTAPVLSQPLYEEEMIFNPQATSHGHVHASCIVECPNGDLRAVWYENGVPLPAPYFSDQKDKSDDVRIGGRTQTRRSQKLGSTFCDGGHLWGLGQQSLHGHRPTRTVVAVLPPP